MKSLNKWFDIMKEEFKEEINEPKECQHEWVQTDEWYECRHCHRIQTILIDSIEAPSQSSYIFLAYQPLTHLKSRLAQLQGKENKDIPYEIIELCRGCNTYKDVLKILKSNKKPQYYKHKIKILNELGQPIPSLTSNEEQKIIDIFKQRFPLRQAKNSIPYQFILFKILSLIKREDLHPFIDLTKNKTKLKKYEMIFTI
jgi:hypothetical protein